MNQISTDDEDFYVNSDPVLSENGELIILGKENILTLNMKTNTTS